MKRLSYILATAAVTCLASCGGGKSGYVITGTVEGGADGDTVLLQERVGRDLNNLDTAIIKDGKFVFEGVQDSAVYRYISWSNADSRLIMDLFLENGTITVNLSKDNDSATGTPNNDAYQQVRSQLSALGQQGNELYKLYSDTASTDEQKADAGEKIKAIEEQMNDVCKKGIYANINSPVGVQIFKSNYYEFTTQENDSILGLIPEQFMSDEGIMRIKEITDKQKVTAPGAKFVDFEMQTPDGKAVKLSDYVGKGKLVLVDFWASWCGPCRREMPNIVEIYKAHKGDKFEIVGVSLDKELDSWKDAIKNLNITWPQMSDLKYWASEGASLYAVNSIPHTMLIDGDGIIVARGLHGEELSAKVDELLK
jgi:peroxiredoxin